MGVVGGGVLRAERGGGAVFLEGGRGGGGGSDSDSGGTALTRGLKTTVGAGPGLGAPRLGVFDRSCVPGEREPVEAVPGGLNELEVDVTVGLMGIGLAEITGGRLEFPGAGFVETVTG